ncbi:sec-independent protein translocase protein TatB [Devosia lucknowensis]|uniref:Sec-independent protein translocase protein TatB n=1 Tax=Devosia lucknowensis TaxID=1096929 RepID=A0A1Y6EM96_9HYPH|nr:Sec-independent protein translocase protein TatB [Devosia lucknowensis]SMQ63784.1 sec-independent protein translocase protein TatB [Devosia lucknowensis]
MLGLGWTEMLVIGVVALIVIGPKDLPVVMGRVGKVIGQIQRMGREFQREINKTTGLDEVRNLRSSITSPLKKTADEIRRDFNAIGKDGKEQPSGALKPTDPNTESVVEAIQQQAGMSPAKKSNDELAADYGFKPATSASEDVEQVKPEPIKAVRPASKKVAASKTQTVPAAVPKAPAKSKAARTKAALAEAEAAAAAVDKPKAVKAASKPAKSKAATPKAASQEKPVAKPRASRKKPVDTAGKTE